MSVFRASDDELYINALVLKSAGARGRPGYALARWAGSIFKLGVLLSCINLAIVSLGIVSMFVFRFPVRLSIHLFLVLFFWSIVTGVVANLSPMILGTVQTGLDYETATLDVALSKLYYLNFGLIGVNLLTFFAAFAIGEGFEKHQLLPLLSILALLAGIVVWSGYCYVQISRGRTKSS